MNELNKFIKIREEFSKKLEPAVTQAEKSCWDFFISSTPETQKAYEKSEDEMYNLYRDENIYAKLKNINKTELPKHEAKQLKDLIKLFEEELHSANEKKALRKKEADIGQKYNTYIPKIDDKEVTKTEISKILQTETNPDIREKAYLAKIKGGDLISQDLIELVKMRNEYAKTKGYNNYFDYMLEEEYDVEPAFLDKLINEVFSGTKKEIRLMQEKKQKELKEFFKTDTLKASDFGLLLDSNPEKKVNEILFQHNIEEISKQTYKGMGYDIEALQKEGKLTLDLYPRKGKNTHGFCFGVIAGKDSRILANLMNNLQSLDTLNHELGHCIYDLGLSLNLPFIDRKPSSSAFTEAIAMMMGDIMKTENILKDIIPDEFFIKFKASHVEDELSFVASSMRIIDFERSFYNNPEQDPSQLWADMKRKYLNRDEKTDNEWATIPHYLTHPAYYQNYFRAALMKTQIYNYLLKQLGNITENKKSKDFMNKNIFELGASIEEYDLIEKLTGKPFGSNDFIKTVTSESN